MLRLTTKRKFSVVRNVGFSHLPITVGGCSSSCRSRLSHSIGCRISPLNTKNPMKEEQYLMFNVRADANV